MKARLFGLPPRSIRNWKPRRIDFEWCERLERIAREAKSHQVKLWLVSPEGFSREAAEVLKKRNAYGSSRRQAELLRARLTSELSKPDSPSASAVVAATVA
jgi:hypothetical protein